MRQQRPHLLVLAETPLATDPRVDRQIRLLEPHFDVTAAGMAPPKSRRVRFIDLSFHRAGRLMRLKSKIVDKTRKRHGQFEAAYWNSPWVANAMMRLRHLSPDCIVANDLQTLPVALKIAKGCPVLADAHEYYPEQKSDRPSWRRREQPFWEYLCRQYMPQASAVTTVAPGIAELYKTRFGIRCHCIPNVPALVELPPRDPGVSGNRIRIIHHGGADPRRQLHLMIETLSLLDSRFELALMLMGDRTSAYRKFLEKKAAHCRRSVSFLEPVPTRQIASQINAWDIGMYILPPSSLNYHFALPNKFFEFIQGRLALAVGPSVEMASVVTRHGLGVVAQDFQPQTMARCLNRLTSDQILDFKRQSCEAASFLCWDRVGPKFLEIVQDLMAKPLKRAG